MNTSAKESTDLDIALSESTPAKGKGLKLPFDPLRVLDALIRHWVLIVLAGLVCGALGFALSLFRFRDEYSAGLHLIRQEPPNAFRESESGESFKPRTLAVPTLVSIMRSPTLLQRVTEGADAKVTPGMLLAGLNLVPERNTDLIRLEFKTAASAKVAAQVLNRYAHGVVELTRDMQSEEAATVARFLQQQIARTDGDLEKVNSELLAYGREVQLFNADKEFDAYLRKQSDLDLKYETTRIEFETIGLRIAANEAELAKNSPGSSKLQTARDELTSMLAKFTDANPLVKEQRAKVEAIEKQTAAAPSNANAFPQAGDGGVADSLFLEIVQLRSTRQALGEQVKKLDEVRTSVAKQLSALPEKQMHAARIQARKQSLETGRTLLESRLREAELFVQNTLGYYRILAPATPDEVTVFPRSKKIIILTLLGLLGGAALAAAWATRRGALDGRVKTAADLRRATGLDVLTSQPAGLARDSQRKNWAFRTWTSLRGRLSVTESGGVIGFLSRESGTVTAWIEDFAEAAQKRGQKVVACACSRHDGIPLGDALISPEQVLEALLDENPVWLTIGQDFTWSADMRTRWHRAAQLWQDRAGAVVLLEITAPGESESVLLCERLPEILVVAESGVSTTRELTELVAPYRDSGCALAGAGLAAAPTLRPAWLAEKFAHAFVLLAALCAMSISATAAEPAEEPAKPTWKVRQVALREAPSETARAKLVKPAWLEKFVLGPGDGFNIEVYGHPELTRNEVFVGADGRINYLQAQGVQAAGLTVDELRERLNTALAAYYQHAQVVLSPIAFQSKRVFVLGKVINKGAVVLDRPLTILEAVAEAGGLETGLFQQNTVELADLPRSLLVRRGKRLRVNFEQLFFEGDMSQNLTLEPDDYLFFPSSSSNDFHVFGSVRNPGTQGLTSQASVIAAISIAGGFMDKAWRKNVLVVRGSLSRPQTFVVNVEDILAGRAKDFPIEPSDIIYVADRPWAKAEVLLETAVSAFTQAAIGTWAGAKISPLITRPLLPQ